MHISLANRKVNKRCIVTQINLNIWSIFSWVLDGFFLWRTWYILLYQIKESAFPAHLATANFNMCGNNNGNNFKSTLVALKIRGTSMYHELLLEISLEVTWVSSCPLHSNRNLMCLSLLPWIILCICHSMFKYTPMRTLLFHQNEERTEFVSTMWSFEAIGSIFLCQIHPWFCFRSLASSVTLGQKKQQGSLWLFLLKPWHQGLQKK